MSISSFNDLQLESKRINHNTCISCILVDEHKIYVGGLDGNIKIWTLGESEPEGTLKGHKDLINAMVMLKDKSLLSASDDGCLIHWDLKSNIGTIKLLGHEKSVTCCSVIYNRRLSSGFNIERGFTIVSGSWDQTIRVWDIAKQRALRILKGHSAPIKSVVHFENEGQITFVSAAQNGEIFTWDLMSLAPIQKIRPYTRNVNKLVVRNETIISSGHDNKIKVWNKDLTASNDLETRTSNVRKFIVFRENWLVALCGTKSVEVWNLQNKKMIQKKDFDECLMDIVSLDEKRILLATRKEGLVFKYVNKPLVLMNLLHRFRKDMNYPPIVVKQLFESILE